ncbi:SDR family oxidoreductase [Pseudomaricurvus alkylphenolicus]|uniref:SDR family oxidoreductase n=1 Tax=Pseudomaricurvus alkylphenolicus TaxID=1306991 RepID=UPI001421F805|nr:SDR family oxidoreductase [Pseudomaricurvus alkylphenolicus]NIB40499.1 SDR family oxidoreductase [Pseudomaricurvus alkylphenolicus]
MKTCLNSLFSLEGRTALITGGTSGIGLMMARSLMLAGARVILVGRNPENCQQKISELNDTIRTSPTAEFISADLSSEEGLDILVTKLISRTEKLSILINNAGMTAHSPLGTYPGSHFDDIMALNVKTPFLLAQALLPQLKANATAGRPSHIINTGSIGGIVHTTPDSFAYGPSKAALHHMTKVLAKRLASDHILVNALAPGLFPSKMSAWITEDPSTLDSVSQQIPVGRIGHPDDIARALIALVSGSYQTGTIVALDGGMAL